MRVLKHCSGSAYSLQSIHPPPNTAIRECKQVQRYGSKSNCKTKQRSLWEAFQAAETKKEAEAEVKADVRAGAKAEARVKVDVEAGSEGEAEAPNPM